MSEDWKNKLVGELDSVNDKLIFLMNRYSNNSDENQVITISVAFKHGYNFHRILTEIDNKLTKGENP